LCYAPGTSFDIWRVGAPSLRWIGLMAMPTGRVKFFNTDRGFGFILPDDGGPDVFVHVHDVEAAGMKTLVADQLVAYEVGPARDGRTKAVNLPSLNKR
jgi:cold shock protein